MRKEPVSSRLVHWINNILFPLKMVVPQPLIAMIPGLTTNEDIRTAMVLGEVRGRLLDIGCGRNRLVTRYRAMGGEGLGIDVHPWGGVDLVVSDPSKLSFPDGSFDTITFVASFNHIPNREEVLQESRRLLSPGGRVVVTNLRPLVSRVWHAWAYWDEDRHVRRMKDGEVWGFMPSELSQILARNGFRVCRVRSFSWGLNGLFIAERVDELRSRPSLEAIE